MNFSPCKDCKDRHTACWPTCAKYIAFTEKVAEEKKERRDFNIRRANVYAGR